MESCLIFQDILSVRFNRYKGITRLSNEICPEVKLRDFNVFLCADCRSEIRFAIPPKFSEQQAQLD